MNPAAELLGIFDEWRNNRERIGTRIRKAEEAKPLYGWSQLLRAETLLYQILRFYQSANKPENAYKTPIEALLSRVHQTTVEDNRVLAPNIGGTLSSWLHVTSDLMDSTGLWRIATPSDEVLEDLRNAFEEMISCIDASTASGDSLVKTLRDYAVRGLTCLDTNPINFIALRDISFGFIGTLGYLINANNTFIVFAEQHFSESDGIKNFFRSFALNVGNWIGAATSGAAGGILATVIEKAITK